MDYEIPRINWFAEPVDSHVRLRSLRGKRRASTLVRLVAYWPIERMFLKLCDK